MKATLCLVIIPHTITKGFIACQVLLSFQDLLTEEWSDRMPCAAKV
jgi:hypothetical protein